MYHKGVGGPGLSRYLAEANREVEVWLQVRAPEIFACVNVTAVVQEQLGHDPDL